MAKQVLSPATHRAPLAAALALLTLAACAGAAPPARAQSGRKAPKVSAPPPAARTPAQGESESGAKPAGAKRTDALVSFVVMRYESMVMGVDPQARDGVAASFLRRLGQSAAVAVTDGGKGGRQEARSRAREEKTAFVVVFQLDEEAGSMSVNADSRTLVVRTYVYAPQTADLKYTDVVHQRAYRDTARIGGVRIPVPTRRVQRYPSQHELEQAARDAADRLLSRFQVTPPPDN